MNEGKLVLFVVSKQDDESPGIQEYLRTVMKRKLPRHYLPDEIIPVDEIPITKHGKHSMVWVTTITNIIKKQEMRKLH